MTCKNHKKFIEHNFQHFNADLNASPAMLPRGRLLSPVSMGNMHKGVIISKKTQTQAQTLMTAFHNMTHGNYIKFVEPLKLSLQGLPREAIV